MVDFRSRNIGNPCISERLLKNVIQVVVFQHRKVHFLESDIFALATQKCALSFPKRALSYSKRALRYSETRSNTLGIRIPFEKKCLAPISELADLEFDRENDKSKEPERLPKDYIIYR